jgi:hypothetical protein
MIMLLLLALAGGGCDEAISSSGGGGDSDTDADTDTDTDADSDSDSDADSDTGTEAPQACDCTADVAVTQYDQQGGFSGPSVFELAQSFVPTVSTIGEVEIFLCEQGADLPPHTLWLHSDTEGAPTNVALASAELDAEVCTYPDFTPICVDFGGVEIESSQTHWLVLEFGGEFTETEYCEWATIAEDTYGFGYGAIESATGWTPIEEVVTDPELAYDFAFRICEPG